MAESMICGKANRCPGSGSRPCGPQLAGKHHIRTRHRVSCRSVRAQCIQQQHRRDTDLITSCILSAQILHRRQQQDRRYELSNKRIHRNTAMSTRSADWQCTLILNTIRGNPIPQKPVDKPLNQANDPTSGSQPGTAARSTPIVTFRTIRMLRERNKGCDPPQNFHPPPSITLANNRPLFRKSTEIILRSRGLLDWPSRRREYFSNRWQRISEYEACIIAEQCFEWTQPQERNSPRRIGAQSILYRFNFHGC